MNYFLARLLPLIFIVFGAILVYCQTTEFFLSRQSKSWPSTTGILSVKVGPYRKTLSYQYSVDGTAYTSDRVIFGELGNRKESNEWSAVGNLPSGSEVVVYYMPKNPKESTLNTKLRPGSGFNFVVGVVMLTGCGLMFILVLKGKFGV